MTQHNILNIRLSNLKPNKLKLQIKNGTEVTLKLSLNVTGDSIMKLIFKLLQTNTYVSRLRKTFANGSSAHIMKNVLKPLAKNVLIPLELTAAASATDAAIHKKMFGCRNTTLIISNEETNNVMKIVKSLEKYGLLIDGVGETIKNKAKEQKGRFLGMLFGTLGPSLLRHLLTGKATIIAGEGTIRVAQDF